MKNIFSALGVYVFVGESVAKDARDIAKLAFPATDSIVGGSAWALTKFLSDRRKLLKASW